MSVYTSATKKLLAVETIACFSALFLEKSAADLTTIATLLNSEKTKQAVVKKTGWQLIESVSFGNGYLCLAFGAAKMTISLTHKRVFLQTFTAERVKTRYSFRLRKIIQANRTFNMFFEVL